MIEVYPVRPPEPTDENISSSNGPLQNIERCIVFLQFQHLPEKPFLRASDLAASAWKKGTVEYLRQCDAIRSGPIRGHLQLGNPDNVDKKGNLLLTKRGKKQSRAYTIQSFRNTLTLESFQAAAAVIDEVCVRYAVHVAAGRRNVHFYYDPEENRAIEYDLDKGEFPVFPDSHTSVEKEKGQARTDEEGDLLGGESGDQSVEDDGQLGTVVEVGIPPQTKKPTNKSIPPNSRLRKALLYATVAVVLVGLCILIPHSSKQNRTKAVINEAVSDALFDQAITAYESSCFLPTYPSKPFMHKGLINRQQPLTPGTLIPFELAITQLHPRVRSPINLLDSPP